VLTAENGPARIAPQNPGGVQEPYKGFKIYEQPAPPDEDVDTATTPAVAAPPAAKPTPVVAAPPAPPKPVVAAAPPPPVVAKVAAPAPKVAAVAPAPAPAKPAPAAAKPAPVVAKTVLPPPAASVPPGPATAAPRSLAPVPAKPAATPAAAPTPAPVAASGAYVLQIGAYKSQAEADGAWNAYKAKHAALLSGASDNVQQADLGDKGTWYRLRIVGFSDKDVASAMCDRLKADGGSCFLGK
jgi:hypothetical protein